jgi:hypothetical protein
MTPGRVEGVRHVVREARSEGAVVRRVGRLDVEVRRLQEAGREDKLVELRIKVRVGRRWRELPAIAIGWLCHLASHVVDIELPRRCDVRPQRAPADLESRNILPVVGIADPYLQHRKLGLGPLPGLRRHPGKSPSALRTPRQAVPIPRAFAFAAG